MHPDTRDSNHGTRERKTLSQPEKGGSPIYSNDAHHRSIIAEHCNNPGE